MTKITKGRVVPGVVSMVTVSFSINVSLLSIFQHFSAKNVSTLILHR